MKRRPNRREGRGAARQEESIDVLRPDAKNARRMGKERLDGLKYSMSEFGDLSGIVWNEQLGDLVAGHQRMRGLRAAGVKTWSRGSKDEGYIVHPKTGERFKVRIVRWDEPKHRAAQLVANNPHIQGEFTEEVVPQLRELRALEDAVAFDALRLDELQSDLDREAEAAEKELAKGAAPETPPSKFSIVIECRSEAHQAKLLKRFERERLTARPLNG
jgi:ParB-like chromosome segregation protein Spo0J